MRPLDYVPSDSKTAAALPPCESDDEAGVDVVPRRGATLIKGTAFRLWHEGPHVSLVPLAAMDYMVGQDGVAAEHRRNGPRVEAPWARRHPLSSAIPCVRCAERSAGEDVRARAAGVAEGAAEGVGVMGAGGGDIAVAASALIQCPGLALELLELPARGRRGRPRAEAGGYAPVRARRRHQLYSSRKACQPQVEHAAVGGKPFTHNLCRFSVVITTLRPCAG